MKWQAWAFVNIDGGVCADTDFRTEREAWICALAERMDDKAIAEAKECGYRVVRVTIEEIEE